MEQYWRKAWLVIQTHWLKAWLVIQTHSFTLSCLQFAIFYRRGLHLLMTNTHIPLFSRPPKQVNLSFPGRLFMWINSNLLVGESSSGSKELSLILAPNTDKSAIQVEKRLKRGYPFKIALQSNDFTVTVWLTANCLHVILQFKLLVRGQG